MKTRVIAAAIAAAALAASATAQAAPNRTGTLASVGASYKWDGGPITGAFADSSVYESVGCVPQACDDTLLNVTTGGNLSVKTSNPSASAVDLDMFVYKSDANGTEGKLVKSSAGGTAIESTNFDADPGYYLVRLEGATAVGATYSGEATLAPLTEDPNAADTPVNTVAPAPTTTAPAGAANAAPISTIKKPKGKKIKAIKGTAIDNSAVKKVAVGLSLIKGKKCFGLTAKGSFKKLKKCGAPILLTAKGTKAWTLKLKKPLKKGSYVAYSIATDDKGVVEAGYGKKNKVAFKVK